ncbi:glycosyltransferase family 2 protein [Aquibacillus kalidii]|uniref:glycosyltransferase family 2 protein n=1 Tax=Aquibacillus kalidii TaxID=2762597 RepID=UPI0016461AA7|nr:glycosyltransferase [Aquibacillus kalidii]
MGKLISIIVPVYNAKDYVEACIKSLLNQTYRPIEIILVDDGSFDGSEDICKYYSSQYNNIHCKRVINGGVSRARNIGLEMAKGTYIGFVDADDYVSERMYEELYSMMVSVEDCDLAVCELFSRNDEEVTILTASEAIHEIFNVNSFGGFSCNKLFKKDIIDSCDVRFSENIYVCEDTLFCFQYCQEIENIIYSKERLYFYRKHNESAFNKGFNNKQVTVIVAFNEIIRKAKKFEESTTKMIQSNFVLIVLKMCVKALQSNNKEDLKYYKKLRESIVKYFKVFLINNNISYKYKLFGVFIMYFPLIVRLLRYRKVIE